MIPEIKTITTANPEYAQMLSLRDEVLRRPLGMSVYEDDLSKEPEEELYIAMADGKVIGCLIAKKLGPGTAKLRQMAVSVAWQGKGIGVQLVRHAEASLKESGHASIELNARAAAIPFYEKLGYTAEGGTFTEVGLPHRLMKKSLV